MVTLYRNYDRAELDVQYNARATVPDILPILKKYADDSAMARQSLDGTLMVSYGESETTECKRQSDDYVAAWRERGFPGQYVPMPGTNHYDIVLTLNDPHSPLTRAIFDQMGLAPAPSRIPGILPSHD